MGFKRSLVRIQSPRPKNLLTRGTDYEADAMLRAAVERQFEISGEALAQVAKLDEELASRIGQHRRIIAFRNILIHGYADVDDRLAWDIIGPIICSNRLLASAQLAAWGIPRSRCCGLCDQWL